MGRYYLNSFSKKKMICMSDKMYLFAKGMKIFCVEKNGKIVFDVTIPGQNKVFIILSNIPLFRRMLRLEPRCGCFFDNNNILVSFHGKVYNVDIKNKNINIEHSFTKGMNNPLSFSKIQGVCGFSDGVLYGEYTNDGIEKEVSIYHRNKEGKWSKVYTFPKGVVKHVHTIIPSVERSSVFVFTGDSDSESGIWEFKNGFKTVYKKVDGSQLYRGCVANIVHGKIVYITDMPDKQNYIVTIDWDDEQTLRKIAEISGPCIYGTTLCNGDLVFSTSVEGDSQLKGIRSWISNTLGKGVKDRYSHVYKGNLVNGFEEIFSIKKDFLPLKLFGFGTITFPQGNSETIYAVGNCLYKQSGKTFVLEKTGDEEIENCTH